ncbi:S49 family peptidase [Chromobacterium haemolyticum]|uniref:S49 family peptidase n=1 Tax=Chromobacterium haemolyticum TaxID=394935 RepID=UPI00307D172F
MRLRELPGRKPAACAVLLRVSSNGGAAGSAEAIIEAVKLCREELGLPIVALVMETALSAGLLIALAADRVVVTPSATLGGAGAIVRLLSPSALLSKLGLRYTAYASNALKDMFSHCSDLAPEAEQALHELVQKNGRQFMATILQCRPALSPEGLERLAAGQVVNGTEAAALGLADVVGGFYSAVAECGRLAGHGAPLLRFVEPASVVSAVTWPFLDGLFRMGKRWLSP